MQDAYTLHAHEDGIVDKVLYGVESLVAAHAAHIQVLVEVLAVVVYGLLGEVRDVVATQALHKFV